LDLNQALGHLQKTLGSGPFVPDGDGRVRVAFADGLELFLIPAARGQAVAEVPLKPLPTAQGPREERIRSLLGRALAMMKSTEEVLALDEAQARPVLWRRLELPEMTPAVLEEAVARLLDRAEWLAGEAAPVVARPAGPMLFFP
jgi:Tir chaperone protein (CesT) family